jgi:hypothetical protein
MSKRVKEWARTARTHLVARLGGCCCDCGSTEKLEFDCIAPCGDGHHRMDTSARISFYRKQFRHGNLALRCQKCNGHKADLSEADWQVMRRTLGLDTPPELNSTSVQYLETTIIKGDEQVQQLGIPVIISHLHGGEK